MAGTIEKLKRGEWSGLAPRGYDQVTLKGEQQIRVNETGLLLRKAFHWKAGQQMSNTEIKERLFALGIKVTMQDLTNIFRNPFYSGIIAHKMLDGEIIKGKHEQLIT